MKTIETVVTVAAGITIILAAVLCRFGLVPAGDRDGPIAYRLDRWTGKVAYVSPYVVRDIDEKSNRKPANWTDGSDAK